MSFSSASLPHQQSPNPYPKGTRSNPSRSLSSSEATSQSPSSETSSDRISRQYGGYDIPNILRAAAAFRQRNGVTASAKKRLPDFLQEVKDFVPKGTTLKYLFSIVIYLKLKFRENPIPGPDSTDDERNLYELGLKAWGPARYIKIDQDLSGFAKRNRMAADRGEDEEMMEWDSDEEDEMLEDYCPYQYLKHALEDFWIAKNYDLNILHMALPKIDTDQAMLLEEQFMKIERDELKLKFEKNRLSNHIINALCNGMEG